jgi:cytoskeletal protein CcmA (bactofilin family)
MAMLRMGRGKNEPAAPQQPEPTRAAPPQPAREQAPAAFAPPAQAPPRVETHPAAQAPQESPVVRPTVEQTGASHAVSETDALARGMKDGAVGGFVGGAGMLSGEITFRGMMRVDGRVSGHVNSQDGTLVVSSGGRVEAQISVAVARINGTVVGDITAAERIELGRTAHVTGDLRTPALVVEQGAIFEGNCRMGAAESARVKGAA